MASLTCVVDAKYLIYHVQEVKDLVYGGEIRLHIPTCTFENVEKICQPPLLQKESQKEPPSKKSLSKVSGRKEQQPLFDLNPRIAREFLSRYQSRTNQTVDDIVTFQLPSQQFTQWKNEEEKAIKAEQPPEQPPSSFAQALLRKLNIVEEESGPKAPAKPRLVAKDAAINKTPWKYHKVPNIPSAGIPVSMKPLLSCMLWLLHEYENNPLNPQTFVLATGDKETVAMAKKLGIPLQDIKELWVQVAEKLKTQDTRNEIGLEEITVGVKAKEKISPPIESEAFSSNGEVHETNEGIEQTTNTAEPMSRGSPAQPGISVGEPSPLKTKDLGTLPVASEVQKQDPLLEDIGVPTNSATAPNGQSNVKDLFESTPDTAARRGDEIPDLEPLPEVEASGSIKTTVPQPSPIQNAAQPLKAIDSVSTDEDSDVDIVVFKPKSRPGSSYIKRPLEATKPSPSKTFTQVVTHVVTEGQPENQAEQPVVAIPIKSGASPSNLDSPKKPVVQEPIQEDSIPVFQPQKPRAPLSYTAALEMGLPKKAVTKPRPMNPISSREETKSVTVPTTELPASQPSHLVVNSPHSRPQTPRGGHVQGQNGFQNQSRQHHHRPQIPRDAGKPQHQDHRRSKKQSPQRTYQPKTIHSRSPSGEPSQLPPAPVTIEATVPPTPLSLDTIQRHSSSQSSSSNASSNKGNHCSPSEGPSNAHNPNRNRHKNHPSYPRFNQVSAKAQRVAQHQPTTTPIVIDADSFDRSSYVKPQFHAIQAHNVNAYNLNAHNLNAHDANTRAINEQAQYTGTNGHARFAGGRGGAMGGRGISRAADGDVDFVLKSGTPRGRGRGTGRLWVP